MALTTWLRDLDLSPFN